MQPDASGVQHGHGANDVGLSDHVGWYLGMPNVIILPLTQDTNLQVPMAATIKGRQEESVQIGSRVGVRLLPGLVSMSFKPIKVV